MSERDINTGMIRVTAFRVTAIKMAKIHINYRITEDDRGENEPSEGY